MRYGREMGYTTHDVKRIYRDLKRNKNKYPNLVLCTNSNCRSGCIIDSTTNKTEDCPVCKGYGFFRRV